MFCDSMAGEVANPMASGPPTAAIATRLRWDGSRGNHESVIRTTGINSIDGTANSLGSDNAQAVGHFQSS